MLEGARKVSFRAAAKQAGQVPDGLVDEVERQACAHACDLIACPQGGTRGLRV